jgi:ELWxxDGT repeat protein
MNAAACKRRWTVAVLAVFVLSAFAIASCSSGEGAGGGGPLPAIAGDAGGIAEGSSAADGAELEDAPGDVAVAVDAAPPAVLESGVWLMTDTQRTRDGVTVGCFAMMMQLSLGSSDLSLGERAFPCGADTTGLSAFALTVSGTDLLLQGTKVGTITPRTLSFVVPGGAMEVTIDLDRTDDQYREVVSAFDVTTTFTAKLTHRPDATPVALASSVSAIEDQSAAGTLRAASLPHAAVTFATVAGPSSGTLDAFDPDTGAFSYRGSTNFAGADAFTFSAASGGMVSAPATVDVTLAPVEDAPIASSQAVVVAEDTPAPITLSASDPDGDPLTFVVGSGPAHGSLSAAGPVVTYTPNANYSGSDSFTYSAHDASASSQTVTVSITVTPVNDAPVAIDQTISTREVSRHTVRLAATDVDSANLTYTVSQNPAHGTLSGTAPLLVYAPQPGFVGDDVFHFTASDGSATSQPATVTVHVLPALYQSTELTTSFAVGVEWQLATASRLFFTAYSSATGHVDVFATDGTDAGTVDVKAPPSDTAGFDGSATRFFALGTTGYFTTATTAAGERLYQSSGGAAATVTEIPPPSASYTGAPTIGSNVAVANGVAHLLLQWQNGSDYACEIWSTDGTALATTRLYAMPVSTSRCSGIWSAGAYEYFFVGSSLMRFQAVSAPAVVQTLGAASPTASVVAVGSELFFETSTAVSASSTAYDLWKSDGTADGTVVVKNVDSGFLAYPAAYLTPLDGELFYSNRKSLWKTDGTALGTVDVADMPTSSYGGVGAINYVYAIGSKLYFQANTDTLGGEPWVSDGTTLGTVLLGDLRPGTPGSRPAHYGPDFQPFNSLVVFGTNDGVLGPTLWATDGTPAGTRMEVDVPAEVVLGTVNGRLVVYGSHHLYAVVVK